MKNFIFVFFIFLSAISFSQTIDNFNQIVDKNEIISFSENEFIYFNSNIDWAKGIITVTAAEKREITHGRELYERYIVLKSQCINRAALILDNINISSTHKIGQFKGLNPNFEKKLNLFINSIDTLEQSYDKDNQIITYSINIQISGKGESLTSLITDTYLERYFSFNLSFLNILSPYVYADNFTGIIIDAREIDLETAILPKISTDTKEVYNPKNVDKKTLNEKGAVQYIIAGKEVDAEYILAQSLKQEVEALKRTGIKPEIIKAHKSSGEIKTDVMISEADALKLLDSNALKNSNISIIVDDRIAGIIGLEIGEFEIKIVKAGF